MLRAVRARRVVVGVLGVVVAAALVGCSGGSARPAASVSPTSAAAATSTTRASPTRPCPLDVGRRALDVRYASRPGTPATLTSLDVYTPSRGCPAPVVVWFHGGTWQSGDKAPQMAWKVRAFNDAGYVLVSVNYRLVGRASPDRSRYPAFDQDGADSVAWVHDHIARYGGDPQRIALVGVSAGAGIVAAVATDPRYLAPHHLGLAAIRGAAPLDTDAFDVAAQHANPLYQDAFGSDPAVWQAASPVTHVAAGRHIPPFFLLTRSTGALQDDTAAFAAALRGAGVPVTTVDPGAVTRDEVDNRLGTFGDAVVTPPLLAFLRSCFAA